MSIKQDRIMARTPVDLERKYNFGKSFAEVMGVATGARDAADGAMSAIAGLDGKLDHEEIFNRLTNYGASQGLYRGADGDLYINASYIKTGEFLADLIKAGVLQSKDGKTFYLDLDEGVLKMNANALTISDKTVDDIAGDAASKAQSNAEKYADDAAKNAVAAQTQEDIFNKLTNNGAYPGLFMLNNQLYVNASYIKTGELAADLIKTGVLQSSDGTLSIDLNGGVANFFNGLFANGLTVRDSKTGDVDLLNIEVVEGYLGNSARLTAKNAAGNTVFSMCETASSTDATELSGVMLELKSPDGVYAVDLYANENYAAISLSKDGVGGAVLKMDETGEVDFWHSKIKGKTVSWKANGDGTYSLIGTD